MAWQFRNDLPIYTQLMDQMKQRIASGDYAPGEKMASVRELAAEAGVNPNTVQRALTELEREGLVYSQRTTGRFITEDEGMIREVKKDLAREEIQGFLTVMKKLGYTVPEILEMLAREAERGETA